MPTIMLRENVYYMTENHSYYDMLAFIIEVMKKWYDWAVSLPEYTMRKHIGLKLIAKDIINQFKQKEYEI